MSPHLSMKPNQEGVLLFVGHLPEPRQAISLFSLAMPQYILAKIKTKWIDTQIKKLKCIYAMNKNHTWNEDSSFTQKLYHNTYICFNRRGYRTYW
jgi:hypothetical protein